MEKLTLSQIAAFTGAVCPQGCEDLEIHTLCRDSRAAGPGALFVPLPGPRFDGHDFIENAARSGASATLTARPGDYTIPALAVPDVLLACQAIAAGYKARFPEMKTLGITGSVGKTTTTRMVSCVLGREHRIVCTGEDGNGQQGLTFTLFGLDRDTEIAVLEMGMSLPGEMGRLSRMARPDIAVINGIGRAHIEFFGTRENILKAKLEILEGMPAAGMLVLNGDDELLWGLRGKLTQRLFYYGLRNPDCDICGQILSANVQSSVFSVSYDGRRCQAELPAAGTHNVLDALAAVSVGIVFGVGLEDSCAALAGFVPAKGRENIYRKNGFTIVDDCYNASPEALEASLGVLAGLEGRRRIACLGDMFELGAHSAAAHAECGRKAAETCDFLIACGDMARYYIEGACSAGMSEAHTALFTDRIQAAAFLRNLAGPGDVILFKGSHGAHIEQVLTAFFEE